MFPAAVAITLILGFALIVYSRQTLPEADSTPPTINDHWHAAYGFYLCDTWYKLAGNLEGTNSAGQPLFPEFVRTGVHSHDDGVMHWHPFTAAATGANAVLGVFLDTYDVELTNETLKFPDNNVLGFTDEYTEGDTQCNGEDAELSVKVWDSYTDTDAGNRYIANMDRVHIDHDGMVFGIYYTAKDADQVMPPWSSELPALGAVDTGQTRPDDDASPGRRRAARRLVAPRRATRRLATLSRPRQRLLRRNRRARALRRPPRRADACTRSCSSAGSALACDR